MAQSNALYKMSQKDAFRKGCARRSRQRGNHRQEKAGGFGGKGHVLGVTGPFYHASKLSWRGRRSWAQESPEETRLGRGPEEKLGGGVAVSVKEALNNVTGLTPWHLGPQAKGHEVGCHFFPGRSLILDADGAEVVKPHKHPMASAKPPQNDCQPASNEPGGDITILVHANRCAKEAMLTHLPALKRQEESPDHGPDRVLKVRDQLDWQKGKALFPLPAEKTGNGDLLFPEFSEELNGIPPIGGDLSIAIRTAADGTDSSNGGR
jgi:hypothetical protein